MLLSSKMQSTLFALEVLQKNSGKKRCKEGGDYSTRSNRSNNSGKSTQLYTALKRVESIFQNAQGFVKIMDKWIGKHILDFVLEVPSNVPVMILTGFLESKSKRKFSSLLERLQKEKNGSIEIRKSEPSEFHDRFIITQNELWQSGPSLKDLGMTKWGTVAKIGNPATKADIERRFDELWNKGKDLQLE